MRFSSLGSGSEGNALLVEARDGTTSTRVLLDCGFSMREVSQRLARVSLEISDLNAILITHEHADHIGGALTLARKLKVPIFMSWGTAQAVDAENAGVDLRICASGSAFAVGDLQLLPYTVPHDAREPLQYVFHDGRARLGVLTDAGSSTAHITASLSGCDALVLECNHDRELLAKSRYPASLKARIGGAHGHLSNDTAAQILDSLDRSRLRYIIAAHLSQQNNSPELARAALASIVGAAGIDVRVASQEAGFEWVGV